MSRIPLITIVGVPNTGKSTLFNRLIGKRKALVHSDAGMTRDIYKKKFEINGKQFYLQDSGGFFPDEQIISREINKRIFNEARVSELIIFLFDGKRELLGYEKDLFLDLKKINNNLIPVINKVDHLKTFVLPSSYYTLKQDFLYISSEHSLEIETLLSVIESKLAHFSRPLIEHSEAQSRISIMGKPNVGKSSIINKILKDEMVIVSPIPGTTRDSVDLEIKRKNKTFILVDNAGIRKLQKVKEGTESAAVIRAEKDIRYADVIILVVDISKKIDQNDLLIAHKILKSAKPVIIACNKWDLVEDKNRAEKLLTAAKRRLNFFYFAPFLLVSAVTGKNVFYLIDQAENITLQLNQKIKTSFLNTLIRTVLNERKFLTEDNRVFNPKYIAIGSYRPFFINFHTTSGSRLKSSHETYLKKRLVEELKLIGIPVFFKINAKKR
jgi:GTPase